MPKGGVETGAALQNGAKQKKSKERKLTDGVAAPEPAPAQHGGDGAEPPVKAKRNKKEARLKAGEPDAAAAVTEAGGLPVPASNGVVADAEQKAARTDGDACIPAAAGKDGMEKKKKKKVKAKQAETEAELGAV